jgi:hypothetical protein
MSRIHRSRRRMSVKKRRGNQVEVTHPTKLIKKWTIERGYFEKRLKDFEWIPVNYSERLYRADQIVNALFWGDGIQLRMTPPISRNWSNRKCRSGKYNCLNWSNIVVWTDQKVDNRLKVYFSLSSTFGLFLCSVVAVWPFNARNDPNVDDREKDNWKIWVNGINRIWMPFFVAFLRCDFEWILVNHSERAWLFNLLETEE